MAIIKNTYDTVNQVFQDIIDPQLEGLKGEITVLGAEVRRAPRR